MGLDDRMVKIRALNFCLNYFSRKANNGTIHNSILYPMLHQTQSEQQQIQVQAQVHVMGPGIYQLQHSPQR